MSPNSNDHSPEALPAPSAPKYVPVVVQPPQDEFAAVYRSMPLPRPVGPVRPIAPPPGVLRVGNFMMSTPPKLPPPWIPPWIRHGVRAAVAEALLAMNARKEPN